MRCDCGMFETCDVCIALAERDLGPYTAEDYARHCHIAVDPAASTSESESALVVYRIDEDGERKIDEIYSAVCLQIVHQRVHAFLTGKQDHSTGIFGGWGRR